MIYEKLAELAFKLIPWKRIFRRKRRCLLVIDDNEADAGFLESLITNAGFRAEVVSTAEVALELVTRKPEKYRVAFVDMRLPLMNGRSLIPKLFVASPSLHIVIVAGTLDDVIDLGSGVYVGLIEKPVNRRTVEAVLRKTRM